MVLCAVRDPRFTGELDPGRVHAGDDIVSVDTVNGVHRGVSLSQLDVRLPAVSGRLPS